MSIVDNALQTMIDNMPEKTGKSLEEWFKLLKTKNFQKHGEYMKFLKGEHGVTHGFANTIAQLYRKKPEETTDDLVEMQYKGKEELRPIYDYLVKELKKFGDDVELAPKKAYVSVRRKKQFAILQPSTKSRFDIGLNIKDKDPEGTLEKAGSWNSMCTHRIKTENVDDITHEVIQWAREAYEGAG
jgi:predicted transport protein